MSTSTTRFFLLATLMIAGCTKSKSQYDQKIQPVFAAIKNFSGSVLIARDNEIIYEKAVGLSNDTKKIPVSLDTKFNICSIGKMLTATIIMQLAEEGKLKLDDTVKKFIPGQRIPNSDKITVHHLLSHTSGLSNYMANPKYVPMLSHPASIDDLLGLVIETPLAFDEPGSRFAYSNSGFIVLGKIIEVVEGKPYADVLKERILTRAGMNHSTLTPDLTNSEEFATGYIRGSESEKYQSNITRVPPPSSDGGLFTTAEDLFIFDKALYTEKLISSASLEKMRTVVSGGGFPYGYGMMITGSENQPGYGHSGGIPGNSAEYRHYKISGHDYVVIIFANHDGTMRAVFSSIEDIVLSGQFER